MIFMLLSGNLSATSHRLLLWAITNSFQNTFFSHQSVAMKPDTNSLHQCDNVYHNLQKLVHGIAKANFLLRRQIIYKAFAVPTVLRVRSLRYSNLVMRKPAFCICENNDADQLRGYISFAVTAKLISAFVFAARIVQSLYFLNPKFHASSHLLRLHSLVYVGPGPKPRRPVFSQRGSFYPGIPCSLYF